MTMVKSYLDRSCLGFVDDGKPVVRATTHVHQWDMIDMCHGVSLSRRDTEYRRRKATGALAEIRRRVSTTDFPSAASGKFAGLGWCAVASLTSTNNVWGNFLNFWYFVNHCGSEHNSILWRIFLYTWYWSTKSPIL